VKCLKQVIRFNFQSFITKKNTMTRLLTSKIMYWLKTIDKKAKKMINFLRLFAFEIFDCPTFFFNFIVSH